jgi:hypothetical protein
MFLIREHPTPIAARRHPRYSRFMLNESLQSQIKEVSSLMTVQMRVRGKTLERQLRKAGRRLPKRLRREAGYLIEAAKLSANPKLVRMVDTDRTDKAHKLLVEHLKSLDPADALKGRILGMLGTASAVLILVFVVVVYVLVQRGLV